MSHLLRPRPSLRPLAWALGGAGLFTLAACAGVRERERGEAALARGEARQAAAQFQAALERRPSYARDPEFTAAFREARVRVALEDVRLGIRQGNGEAALNLLRRQLAEVPSDRRLLDLQAETEDAAVAQWHRFARATADDGKLADARAWVRRALELRPRHAGALAAESSLAEEAAYAPQPESRDPAAQLAKADATLAKNPDHLPARALRAFAAASIARITAGVAAAGEQLKKGQVGAALAALDPWEAQWPACPGLAGLKAEALRRRADCEQALDQAEEAQANGKSAAAEAALIRALAADPSDPQIAANWCAWIDGLAAAHEAEGRPATGLAVRARLPEALRTRQADAAMTAALQRCLRASLPGFAVEGDGPGTAELRRELADAGGLPAQKVRLAGDIVVRRRLIGVRNHSHAYEIDVSEANPAHAEAVRAHDCADDVLHQREHALERARAAAARAAAGTDPAAKRRADAVLHQAEHAMADAQRAHAHAKSQLDLTPATRTVRYPQNWAYSEEAWEQTVAGELQASRPDHPGAPVPAAAVDMVATGTQRLNARPDLGLPRKNLDLPAEADARRQALEAVAAKLAARLRAATLAEAVAAAKARGQDAALPAPARHEAACLAELLATEPTPQARRTWMEEAGRKWAW